MIREGSADFQLHLRRTLQLIQNEPHFKKAKGPKDRAELDKLLKSFIFRYLYFIVSNNGKFLPQLFTSVPHEKFPATLQEALDVDRASISRHDPFYVIDDSVANESHRHTGRNCGRKFQAGEPIYRCKECSFDDTCVLCIHCFNAKDHINHHVYTSICTHVNNGICDCGDVEAWNVPLNCKAETEDEGSESEGAFESPEMTYILELTLTEIFDHFLDVFNQNIEPLPTMQRDITVKLRDMVQSEKSEEKEEFLQDLQYKNEDMQDLKKGLTEIEAPDYTVLVYNDEYHNYSQATAALKQGVPDDKNTDKLTARIDGEGRAMLKCSKDISSVLSGFFAVRTNGLSATLTAWSEYIQQEACKYIIAWVGHCLTIPNSSFQQGFRSAMGRVLCSGSERLPEAVDVSLLVDKHFPAKHSEEDPYRYANLSVLDRENVVPFSHHKVLAEGETDHISLTLNKTEPPSPKRYANSRLQLLLFFDNRYWKKLRKDIQDIVIPTMASSLEFKPIFCEQLVEIFNHMTRSVAFMDREPQLTVLRESVVQLFTCPTNAYSIFQSGSFCDIMWSVIDIFTEFSKKDAGVLVWQKVKKTNPTKSYSISFKQNLYSVETILSKVSDPNLLLRPKEFIAIVTLCKLFNGAWKIKRKEGEHVLREDQNFIPYLEYTTSIYSIVQTVDKILENKRDEVDETLLLQAIKLLSTFLGHRTPSQTVYDSHEIIKFKVSKQPVAFMNPVHTLMSFLIEKVPLAKAFAALSGCNDFLTISDFSLRAVVLCSQIDVGFWVRNGMSVLRQSSYYKNNPEMACYIRDVHLNQLTFLNEKDDLVRLIYNILDRWELLEWFNGKEDFDKTVYEDKIVYILQQFIAFVYQLLTERQSFKIFKSPEEKEYYQIKRAIMYGLYMEPLSYSSLLSAVPEYLTESTDQFDRALEDVSVYMGPKGLMDNGVFKLKPELYKRIDPLQLPNMGNDFEHSASIIKARLAESGEDPKNTVLEPQLISPKFLDESAKNLGAFTRTKVFAKVIYNLLRVSIDLDEGTFLYALLHLVHSILKDDELVNGKNSIPEVYISKPICNLLFIIIDIKSSVFSENVVAKADYLLESLIWKNPTSILESLVSSFGEECVERYKARKLHQGINFEESEKGRKRRLAKERQEKILSKFSRQQHKFMKENQSEFGSNDDDIEMADNGLSQAVEDYTCALCQDTSSVDAFVIPVYHENTPIFRNGDIRNVKEFGVEWNRFQNNKDSATTYEEESVQNFREDGSKGSRKVFVSCNHYIHYKCFKRYAQKKRFSTNSFICPLCQTFSNCVIPVAGYSPKPSESSIKELLQNSGAKSNIDHLHQTDPNEDFNGVFNMFLEINKKNMYYDRHWATTPESQRPDVAYILAVHWANTISMLEVSARIADHPNDSLLQGKEQKFRTLKNVLSSIAWLHKVLGRPSKEIIPYVNGEDTIWNQNQLFQFIVRRSLFSSEPITNVITGGLSVFSRQLLVDFLKGSTPNDVKMMREASANFGGIHDIDNETLDVLRDVCDISVSDEDTCRQLYSLAFASLIKNVLPTIRRCLILLKAINMLIMKSDEASLIVNGINLELVTSSSTPEYINSVIGLITPFSSFNDLLRKSNSYVKSVTDPYLSNIPYEFTGIVKLMDLAPHLNTYLTNSKEVKLREEHPARMRNAGNRLDFKICLTCGVKVHARNDRTELVRHLANHCFKPFGLFLIPNLNEVTLILTNPRSSISISAPYLNSHGEAGRNAIQRGDLTALSLQRYEHLNNVWLNSEVPGLISRVMGDEFRVLIVSNGVVLNFNRNVLRPRRANAEEPDGDSSSSEAEDDDLEGGEVRWEIRPEEFFEEAGIRFEGAGAIPGGDIRDFFQFINNLDTETDAFEEDEETGGEAQGLANAFVPRFEFLPNFRNFNARNEDEPDDEDEDEVNHPVSDDIE
ncbi:E3 ubiquitin-protein ligase UBR1 [Lachancea thermotolerans CBS 6340]|uniref:E3 ubiquitin-protein ligase n=1 Tax=Lachancea thermotolerans (strain ATCC 56472 / CBS 6340 / NRRL Y-8284) TaxID=559295 RepID=C5DCJ9_LACTC|nr:KLTH0B03652p [Lachancea thermotolerans CBS 6340]CAR21510.1 KLTH0B03652p [Lachancea thermotolerans CBS 6340]